MAGVGERVYEMRDDLTASLNILGATIRGSQMKLGRGHAVNPAAIVSQIDRMGVGAGVYTPNQSYHAVDLGDATTRRRKALPPKP